MKIRYFKMWANMIVIALLSLMFGLAHAGPTQTSSTTAATIISNARVYLYESTADVWSDAELLEHLNKGMVDIATQSLATEDQETISLIASTIEYTPATDYIKIVAAQYTNAAGVVTRLRPGHPADVGAIDENWNDSPVPTFWYEFGGKVGIYPTLSSVTTESVKLFLVERPAKLTLTSQNITTPAIYDRALTLYIVAQALRKKRLMADSDYYMQEYQGELDRYRGDFNELKTKAAQ